MKRQRIVAAWLACIMAAFVLPFAALAEGGDIAISLSGGNAALAVGDYLSVNVKFDAAVASFGGAEFNVEYDSAKLEFVSYTPLIGSADETGNGALNYHKKIRDGNIKILLLNAANIINKNSTGIANGTAIGNLVFKVTGANADTASVKIAQEGFAACMPGDNTTAPALTPANSTFTPTTVTVSDSVTYPTGASQSIISEPKAIATKDANGALSPITKPTVTDDPYGGYALGDVNGDGKINTLDAMMTLRAAVGIESLDAIQTIRADIDANGKINTMDAMMILRRAVGLLDENYKNIY